MRELFSSAATWRRHALLCGARAVGAIYRLFVVRARVVLIGLAALLAISVLAASYLTGLRNVPTALEGTQRVTKTLLRPVTPRWAATAAGVVALLVFLRWVVLARTRLVITRFVDYREGEPHELRGLSTLLAAELASLVKLHQTVDDTRADPGALKAGEDIYFDQDKDRGREAMKDEAVTPTRPFQIPATIKVGLSDDREPAISVEAMMDLGWIKLPLGALAALASRMARGQRLTGAVHHVDGRLVLTATSVGGRKASVWRVEAPLSSEGDDAKQRPEDLVDELAVRIFSDVALKGVVKWTATRGHIRALRAYKDCLQTARDRRLNLEQAKEYLVEAIAEDASFHLAHYNLGIVATELHQHDAAEAAFLKAINCNPDAWQSYYGLAQVYFAQGWYREVVPLCGRMVRLGEKAAEGYLLQAQAGYLMDQPDTETKRTDGENGARRGARVRSKDRQADHDREVERAIQDSASAVRASWRRLCAAAARGDAEEASEVAAKCLRNLGGMRAYAAQERTEHAAEVGCDPDERERERPLSRRQVRGYRAAQRELCQAVRLRPSNGELRFELAKLYAARQKWSSAVAQLERAVEIAPDRPRFWIQLARAHAGPYYGGTGRGARYRKARREAAAREVELASRRALERPSLMIDSGFRRLALAHTHVGLPPEGIARIVSLCHFANDLASWKRRWKEWDERPEDDRRQQARTALEAGLRTWLITLQPAEEPRGEPWPVCAVGVELARILVDRSPDTAINEQDRETALAVAEALQGCVDRLRSQHPSEIEQHDVYAVIARLLHIARAPARRGDDRHPRRESPRDEDKTLELAERAVALAPLSVYAQQTLALAQESLGHLNQAEAAWRAALASESDAPVVNAGLGNCLLLLGLQCHDTQHRCKRLQQAKRYLTRAVWLCQVGQGSVSVLGRARVCLGQTLVELDENEGAVEQLELALELEPGSDRVRWHLARAHLQMGDIARGERELRKIRHYRPDPRVDGGSPDLVLARAKLDLAKSQIDRTPDPQLPALSLPVRRRRVTCYQQFNDRHVAASITMIEEIRTSVDGDDAPERQALRAACDDWEGWAKFKLRDYDGAITCLLSSIELEPSSEAYSHLSQVHATRALQTLSRFARNEASALAWDYAVLARRLGLNPKHHGQLERALSRLHGPTPAGSGRSRLSPPDGRADAATGAPRKPL